MPVIPNFSSSAPGGRRGLHSRAALGVNATETRGPRSRQRSEITHGPFQGLKGIITPYDMTVTARSRGVAEVRLRRTLQTVSIPVFQFGMFSETDLAFHAGGTFTFGGRVHTNGNLFLSAGAPLRLGDRITAVGEVLRWKLPNGVAATGGYGGTVSDPRHEPFRALARNEGSLVQQDRQRVERAEVDEPVGRHLQPVHPQQPDRRAAARSADRRRHRWRRQSRRRANRTDPAPGSRQRDPPTVLHQRYYSLASVRILLSDTAADITNLPESVTGAPVELSNGRAYANSPGPFARRHRGTSNGPDEYPGRCPGAPGRRLPERPRQPLVGGFIKIEIGGARHGAWEDVTNEILNFGIVGRNLADIGQRHRDPLERPAGGSGGHMRTSRSRTRSSGLQRLRDSPVELAYRPCGFNRPGCNGATCARTSHDYWPIALYDRREGQFRDGLADEH